MGSTTILQHLDAHRRGIRTGATAADRARIAVLVALHALAPAWLLAGRAGLALPSPLVLVPCYRVADAHGTWEIPGPTGGAGYLFPACGGEPVASALSGVRAGVVLDVGASYGYYAVRLARQIGTRGRVVALEPYPPRYLALRRNLVANGCRDAQALAVAAFDRDGEAVLHAPRFAASDLDVSLLGAGRPFPVVLRRLDGVCDELGLGPLSAVKLDVEGAEAAALRGLAERLERDHPLVVFEARDAAALAACREALLPFGYHIRAIGPGDHLAEPT